MGNVRTVQVSLDGHPCELDVKPKTFSTGSRGYYAWGKGKDADGTRYQITMNIVEIGSKPKTKEST